MTPPKSGPNSAAPTTAEVVGGVYNAAGETLVDGQATPLQTDINGRLLVSTSGGSGTSNVNIADVNGNPPALSNPLPVELSDGTNAVGTAGNPLSVSVTNTSGTPVNDNIAEWGGAAVAAPPDLTGAPAVVAGGPSSTNLITWTPVNGVANATQAIITGSNHYATLNLENVASATAGGSWTLEGSDDNANWQPLFGYSFRQTAYFGGGSPGAPTPININSATQTVYQFSVAGFPYLRMRIITAISGVAATVVVSYALLSVSQQPPVTNPSIVSSNAASPDVVTALGPQNTLNPNTGALSVVQYVSLGSTSITGDPGGNNSAQALRTPAIFKTVQATASGNTALWTPTSGKKFRLMRLNIQLTSNATLAAAAVLTVTFQDATTGIPITHDFYVGQVALTAATALFIAGEETGWIDLGNGVLSAAANNVLNVNLSATLTSGNIRVTVCGTEE